MPARVDANKPGPTIEHTRRTTEGPVWISEKVWPNYNVLAGTKLNPEQVVSYNGISAAPLYREEQIVGLVVLDERNEIPASSAGTSKKRSLPKLFSRRQSLEPEPLTQPKTLYVISASQELMRTIALSDQNPDIVRDLRDEHKNVSYVVMAFGEDGSFRTTGENEIPAHVLESALEVSFTGNNNSTLMGQDGEINVTSLETLANNLGRSANTIISTPETSIKAGVQESLDAETILESLTDELSGSNNPREDIAQDMLNVVLRNRSELVRDFNGGFDRFTLANRLVTPENITFSYLNFNENSTVQPEAEQLYIVTQVNTNQVNLYAKNLQTGKDIQFEYATTGEITVIDPTDSSRRVISESETALYQTATGLLHDFIATAVDFDTTASPDIAIKIHPFQEAFLSGIEALHGPLESYANPSFAENISSRNTKGKSSVLLPPRVMLLSDTYRFNEQTGQLTMTLLPQENESADTKTQTSPVLATIQPTVDGGVTVTLTGKTMVKGQLQETAEVFTVPSFSAMKQKINGKYFDAARLIQINGKFVSAATARQIFALLNAVRTLDIYKNPEVFIAPMTGTINTLRGLLPVPEAVAPTQSLAELLGPDTETIANEVISGLLAREPQSPIEQPTHLPVNSVGTIDSKSPDATASVDVEAPADGKNTAQNRKKNWLNSEPPAPRRSRKKQDTRDWLL